MQESPCDCGYNFFEEAGYGLDFCMGCGIARTAFRTVFTNEFVLQDRLHGHQCYTRLKRFKKYLCRAMRQQSGCTVPKETWDYLMQRGPYRGPKHVHRTLKQARHLKRKCYDSLPFLTAALCPHLELPTLDQSEKYQAIELFKRIDAAVTEGPFISYLYCLEYILKKLGRDDVCDYINQIQCPRRREEYRIRLGKILDPIPGKNIKCLLRTHV